MKKNILQQIVFYFIFFIINHHACYTNNLETTTQLLSVLKTKLTTLLSKVSHLQSQSDLQFNILEKNLQQIAENNGYGYKYANLELLQEICQTFNNTKPSYALDVPIFKGIPSNNVLTFLNQQNEFNKNSITNEWKTFVENNLLPTKDTIQKNKQFPQDFEQKRAKFEERVRKAFDQAINNITNTFQFNTSFGVQQIDELIDSLQNEKLMVRSTGKEDTRALANAGGNETISNVAPQTKEILQAIKEVVASYFGHKSLTQRLGAGDPSIFDSTPFTPVLIQKMIGEISNAVPKCGVMFTEEVEGGISKNETKDEKGKIKTTGITIIQCAYGHNEGVVNSLIPVDTFYVNRTKNIYPIIRAKTQRMAPHQPNGLQLIPNQGPLVDQPALTKEAVLTLKAFSDTLEQYYGYPMDVEFVINEQEKKIYIVQARPITHNKEKIAQPSYLLEDEKIDQNKKQQGSSIGVAGGSVRFIDGAKNIIICEDIGKALATYQNKESVPQPNDIQAIIVGKMAPTTSHEATTFRSENKPVLCIPQWQAVLSWIEQNNQLVISPQQGLIVKTNKESVIVQNGWINYPVPPYVSLHDAYMSEFDQNFKLQDLLKNIVNNHENVFMDIKNNLKNVSKENHASWRSLLETIKQGSPQDSAIALTTLCTMIIKIVQHASKNLTLDEDLTQRRKQLIQLILTYAQIIKKTLYFTQSDIQNYPKRLISIRFLESILFQQPDNDIIDCYSALTLIFKELTIEQKIAKKTTNQISTQLLKIKSFALTDDLADNWEKFVLGLEKSTKTKVKTIFALLIKTLSDLDVLPIWLHTSFAKRYKKIIDNKYYTQQCEVLVKDCFNEYKNQSTFLKKLSKIQNSLESFNISLFDDPKKFDVQWKFFKDQLLSYFIQDEFCKIFNKEENNLGKLTALGLMKKFVDLFDTSIKSVTGSITYSKDKQGIKLKFTNFHTMLLSYRDLLKRWERCVPKGILTYNKDNNLYENFADYEYIINNVLNGKIIFDETQFKRSNRFDLISCTIGNGAALWYVNGISHAGPQTLEDVFMMIHQSLLSVLNALNSTNNRIEIPQKLKTISKKLKTQIENTSNEEGDLKVKLSGIDFAKNKIILIFNVPLRDHSLQYKLSYLKNKQHIHTEFIFAGGNEQKRWNKLAYKVFGLSMIKDKSYQIKIDSITQQEGFLSFNMIFEQDKINDNIISFIANLAAESFEIYELPNCSFFKEFINDITCTNNDTPLKLVSSFTILLDLHEKTQENQQILTQLTNIVKIMSENYSKREFFEHYPYMINILSYTNFLNFDDFDYPSKDLKNYLIKILESDIQDKKDKYKLLL